MSRYFITGGTGFIGRALVRNLLRRPDTEEIILLTRGNIQDRPQLFDGLDRIKYWKGDITEVPFPVNSKFTHLIHGACDANDLMQPDKHLYYYTIVEGTRRIMEWAKHVGIGEILFLSSGVAAFRDTVYGRGKRQSEFLGEHYRLPMKIARIFSIVGEEMPLNGQYAIGKFIGQAMDFNQVRVYGGKAVRSYLHVDDCADWLEAVMDRGEPHVPYEIGGEDAIHVRELADLVGRLLGVPVVEIDGPDKSSIYVPRALETQIALNVKQTISLEESIRRVHAYLNLRHPNVEQVQSVAKDAGLNHPADNGGLLHHRV